MHFVRFAKTKAKIVIDLFNRLKQFMNGQIQSNPRFRVQVYMSVAGGIRANIKAPNPQ